jgi:hypothetical protein
MLGLAAAAAFTCSGCEGKGKGDKKPTSPPPPSPPQPPSLPSRQVNTALAADWMTARIDPRTNLIESFQGLPRTDPSFGVTWVFNQAQAIEGYLAAAKIERAAGNINRANEYLDRAEQLAEGLLDIQSKEDGAWHNAYETDTGRVARNIPEQQSRQVGPNAAVGRALLSVAEATADKALEDKILASVESLSGWMDGFFFDRGAYGFFKSGEFGDGREIPFTSTEENMRAMAFYDRLSGKENMDRADQIAAWLMTKMNAGNRFFVGYTFDENINTDPNMATDVQFLGPLMALHGGRNLREYAIGLEWLLARQTHPVINGKTLTGIPRQLSTGGIWPEGGAGFAASLDAVGRDNEADPFLKSLGELQDADGGIPAAIGGTPGFPGTFPFKATEAVAPATVAV